MNSALLTKERWYQVAIVALVIAVLVLGVSMSQSGDREAYVETSGKYPLLDPAQGLYNNDDLVVNVTPLREKWESEYAGRDDLTIYFEVFGTGANISINNRLALWPASLMKIPVAMAVMHRVEDHNWSLDNELIILEKDKNKDFGELYKEPTGSPITISRLLEEMLINSDNTARNIFMRNLPPTEITAVLEHLGLEDIFDNKQNVRAKKYSIFWRSLYTSSYLRPKSSQYLIELMSRSSAKDLLEAGLPDGTLFSHKIGDGDGVHSDSGIVYYPNRPYALTVMASGCTKAEAQALMKKISQEAYDYVANY